MRRVIHPAPGPGARQRGPTALAPVAAGAVALHDEARACLAVLADLSGRYAAGAVPRHFDAALDRLAGEAAPDLVRLASDLASVNHRLRRAAGLRRKG